VNDEKKVENHIAAVSLYFMHYNFVRIHQMLKVTPAMAAGVMDRIWGIGDIVQVLEEREAREEGDWKMNVFEILDSSLPPKVKNRSSAEVRFQNAESISWQMYFKVCFFRYLRCGHIELQYR
jgi:hypothetical protein